MPPALSQSRRTTAALLPAAMLMAAIATVPHLLHSPSQTTPPHCEPASVLSDELLQAATATLPATADATSEPTSPAALASHDGSANAKHTPGQCERCDRAAFAALQAFDATDGLAPAGKSPSTPPTRRGVVGR